MFASCSKYARSVSSWSGAGPTVDSISAPSACGFVAAVSISSRQLPVSTSSPRSSSSASAATFSAAEKPAGSGSVRREADRHRRAQATGQRRGRARRERLDEIAACGRERAGEVLRDRGQHAVGVARRRAHDHGARAVGQVRAEPMRAGQHLRPAEPLQLVEQGRGGAALGHARVPQRDGGERRQGGQLEHLVRARARGRAGAEQHDGPEQLVARAHLDLRGEAVRHLRRTTLEAVADVALQRGQPVVVRGGRGGVGGGQDDRDRAVQLVGGERRDAGDATPGEHRVDHAEVDLTELGYVSG